MQMKEKISLTGLLLGRTHGWITINPNQSVLQCYGNIETEVRKWLREQPKALYSAGLYALVKRWKKCINAGRGLCQRINVFPRFEYHIFYVLYPFVNYLLTLLPL
jgi:hypothetical protein